MNGFVLCIAGFVLNITKFVLNIAGFVFTSLLRRLHAQTLPDATSPVGKVHPFSKITVIFDALQDLESLTKCQYSLFYAWKNHF